MLVSTLAGDQEELHIVPLDLRLLSNAGRYLSLLASKSTQLHNVLRYVHQVQRLMYNDFKTSQDLPSKFIANIEESLHEQRDCNWMQAAYHLVVTGNCYPEVKEWLVDQLGERVSTHFSRDSISAICQLMNSLGTQAMGEGRNDWLRKCAAPSS